MAYANRLKLVNPRATCIEVVFLRYTSTVPKCKISVISINARVDFIQQQREILKLAESYKLRRDIYTYKFKAELSQIKPN
jgi:hypothetical protein